MPSKSERSRGGEGALHAMRRLAPRFMALCLDRARKPIRVVVGPAVPEPACGHPPHGPAVSLDLASLDPVERWLPSRSLRRRWVVLRTDVSWILRDLRGEPRPPLIRRGPSRYRAVAPSRGIDSATRLLRVVRVVRETDAALSIVLGELDGAPIRFEAGQFLTFQLSVGGQLVRRAYSISSSPLDGPSATITVKRMPGGCASAWMHEHVKEGDTLRALGPSGRCLAPEAREPAHLVMIAGGSGITPVISILDTVLRTRPELDVTLIYGNRTISDVIFFERIEQLRARHEGRFCVDHVLSEPADEWTGACGILARPTLDARLDAVADDGRPRVYYLCGPEPMMDAAREALRARSVAPDRIREECFRSPVDEGSLPARAPCEARTEGGDFSPGEPFVVRMKVRGRDHVVRVEPGQTLLEAGLAAGAALPFSCAMGGCGACKVRLVEGAVESEELGCLTSRERAEGFVLACSARPRGPVAIEVLP